MTFATYYDFVPNFEEGNSVEEHSLVAKASSLVEDTSSISVE